MSRSQRRTKIVCTIGPATGSAVMIERLIRAGMTVARLNLSHGGHKDHAGYIRTVRRLSRRLKIDVAVLVDLPGPKYRVGKLQGGQVILKRGALLTLTTGDSIGDASSIPVTLPDLSRKVKKGDTVLLDDGAMQLKVRDIIGEDVTCKVQIGGTLTEGKGLVVPGMPSSGPFVTETLRRHLDFAIGQEPDFLALSFVSSPEDVADVKEVVQQKGSNIPLVAKIERGEAVRRFDRILEVADAVMVARGDLGVDIPLETIPLVQKEIIRKCNRAGKPVITATQMLESMINSARPTRAEVTDVANAIFDGTDATMLSGETSVGRHPVAAVKMMAKVARQAETGLPLDHILLERSAWLEDKTDELISYNACHTAYRLGAAAIVAFTESGSTAMRVSKYRAGVPIVAVTPNASVAGRLLLFWGVIPVEIAVLSSVDEIFVTASRVCKEMRLAKTGDLIVITAGVPIGEIGSTNLLKVQRVA